MKIVTCENCGRKVYNILSKYVRIENKIYTVCPKCSKIVEEFKEKNSIK